MCDMMRLGLITAKFKTNMAKGFSNFDTSTKNEMSFLFEELLCLGDEKDDNFRTESESNINEWGDERFRLTNITATSFRAILERMAEADFNFIIEEQTTAAAVLKLQNLGDSRQKF